MGRHELGEDSPEPAAASQTRHPWRATLRTTLAASWGLIPLLPYIATSARVDTVPAVASVLTITAAVTRIAADPRVEAWIHRYLSPLAAEPTPKDKEQ